MLIYRFRPEPTKGIYTYDALYGVEYDEINRFNSTAMTLFENQFIQTANLDGVRNYEKLYLIAEDDTLSLEERRGVVYDKMTLKAPFTEARLNDLLTNIFGAGNYIFEVYPNSLEVMIGVPAKLGKEVYDKYLKLLRNIIPANMYILFQTPYTYVYLGLMKYGNAEVEADVADEWKLVHYTYKELSFYSVFEKTNAIYVGTRDTGEIVDLEGAGIAYVSEM